MIVICATCQTKFRVGDEKVGPNGVKVRCGKCKSIFTVQRSPDLSLGPSLGASALDLGDESRISETSQSSSDLPISFQSEVPSPFAPPDGDPFAPPPADDPFAAAASSSASGTDDDPFGAPGGSFEPELRAFGEVSGDLPLTDLSDLATSPAGASFESGDLSLPLGPPPLPIEADGLALEDAERPAPISAQAMLDGLAFDGSDSFQSQETPGLDLGYAVPSQNGAKLDEGPGVAPAWPVAVSQEPRLVEAAAPSRQPAPVRPHPPAEREPVAPQQTAPSRPSDQQSGLRTIVLNSLSLALLIVVSIGLLAVWREGRIGAHAFTPGNLFSGVVGRSNDGSAPVFVADVSSGTYETSAGRRVFFVRGSVQSRNSKPVSSVLVKVELLRGGQVVAQALAPAGGVPTAEELWSLAGTADLERLRSALAGRSPKQLMPGEAAPFLAPFWDDLPDASGLLFRVAIETGLAPDPANPG